MRVWVLILLVVSLLSAANEYGPAEMVFQRTWIVEGSPGTPYTLDGILVINNSNQHVTILDLPEGATIVELPDGILRLNYTGVLTAPREENRVKLRVHIHRNATLLYDLAFEPSSIPATALTEYDAVMQAQAEQLVDRGSMLQTVANIVDWVHTKLEYDISYWGRTETAQTVFNNPRGVCVEYSHLLISMFRSVGFNTRYVSGYVYADEWQPHAWVQVEIPEYGWVDADSTFNQLGVVDNTHMAMHYGEDQTSVYDRVVATRPVVLATDERIVAYVSQPQNPQPLSGFYISNRTTGDISIHITNLEPQYQYVSYSLILPHRYGSNEKRILLLGPNEEKTFHYSSRTPFETGFIYRMPFITRANDFTIQSDFVVERKEPPLRPPIEQLPECFTLFILLGTLAYVGGKP